MSSSTTSSPNSSAAPTSSSSFVINGSSTSLHNLHLNNIGQQKLIDPNRYNSLEYFELSGKLGKGQFSEVLKAKNKMTGRMVAIKKIELDLMKNKKAREDCRKEIDLLKQLQHENIIRYFCSFIVADQSKEYLMIVLELAEAGDLSRLLRTFKKNFRLLPERSIWKYFVQISRAIAYMHSRSIMHRDIKPANVFISSGGIVKLGDLGLGRFLSMETMNLSTFKKGMVFSIVGTPYYMSPERMNESGYSFKSDIWSVGCVLYEMAALQSPFFGEKQNLLALVRKISKCEYPPIPSNIYSQHLKLTVSNCICANPARRFDARDVLTVAEHMHSHFSSISKSQQKIHSAPQLITNTTTIRQPQPVRRIQVSSNRSPTTLPQLGGRQNTQL
uniref:non-specific serine/threonine protein kinase n=1 Tax=Meloidogyne enterolobii TaxID=390850 RepID=A0A6V7XTZ4_MELEN|nr:unnamed protein product [Meloidogyne enterolobii]